MSFSSEEKDFLRLASVRAVIPNRTDFSLESFQENSDEDSVSPLDVEQRTRVFFDERLRALFTLKIPECSEEQLKSWLSRLELHLEVWAISDADDTFRPVNSQVAKRELIFAHQVDHNQDPVVLVTQDDQERVYLNLIWDTIIVLRRPRMRMHDISLVVHPTATIQPSHAPLAEREYLDPLEVLEPNLFQPLQGAKGFENGVPFLPSFRLQRVTPASSQQASVLHLHSTPTRPIRVYPAIITRLRYSRVAGHSPSTALMASLDVEVIPFVNVTGAIEKVDMSLAKGKAECLMDGFLPIWCQSKDCTAFLFQLEAGMIPQSVAQMTNPNIDDLSILIEMTLDVSEECKTTIIAEWTTTIDFSQATAEPRPTSQLGSSAINAGSGYRRSLLETTQTQSTDFDEAVMISFSAPTETIRVGQPFTWQVFVNNKTSKTVKLAVIPLPRMQRTTTQAQHFARRHAPKSSIASFSQGEKGQQAKDREANIALAAMDENVLYAMQHAGNFTSETEIVSLTPELRVGPLNPSQSFDGTVRMVAMKTGAFMLDAVRVIDLVREAEEGINAPGVVVDIRDLPDVIVES